MPAMTDTNAPERIWACYNPEFDATYWSGPDQPHNEKDHVGIYTRADLFAALEAQIATLTKERDAARAVRVKPLKWWQSSTTTFRHTGHPADPFDVTYFVWRIKADRPELWAWGKDGAGQEGMSGYIEHAKAAAQADYEARILAALEKPE
jgi:hypothetical protein